jgi:serine/threonine protein kinase
MTVLYSESCNCWKITDFGTASEATSKRMNTTRYSRGTASYRAPEVIAEDSKFNNRADIWALGCIIYEMSTGVKLFRDDFSVREYSTTKALKYPVDWPTGETVRLSQPFFEPELRNEFRNLSSLLLEMLDLVPQSRPNSHHIVVQLFPYRIDVHFGAESSAANDYCIWTTADIYLLFLHLPTFGTDWDKIASRLDTKTGRQVKAIVY